MNKLKFNVLDTIIILLVVAALLGSAVYTYSRQISMMFVKSTDAVITVSMQAAEIVLSEELSDDDILYISGEESKLGSILTVINRRNSENFVNENGEKETRLSDTSYTVTMKVKSRVKETEKGLFVNSRVFVGPGKKIDLDTKMGIITCRVENIELLETK